MVRTVFMGSSRFSLPALHGLADAEDLVLAGVITQPDRPRGRNRRIVPGPVHAAAVERGLPVLMPERVGEADAVAALHQWAPDVIVVASYGQFIPRSVRETSRIAIVNIHPSLLPKYRGAAPMQRAIANGDTETGVTIFHVVKDMDAGDIILQAPFSIDPDDTGETLEDKLSVFGADLMLRAVRQLSSGAAPRTPQDPALATYAPKIAKEEGKLDWSLPARALHNRVRGFQPWPGCHTTRNGARLRIWKTRVEDAHGPPGCILDTDRDGPLIAAGDAALRLLEVQPEAKPRMPGHAYLLGHPARPGEMLGGALIKP